MAFNNLNVEPSMVQQATTHNYVSSIDLAGGLHKPEIGDFLVERLGSQNLTGLMQMQGAMNGVKSIEYSHYEEEWLHEVVKVVGQAAGTLDGGAGAYQLTETDHVAAAANQFTTNAPNSPYIDTATETTIVPRLADLLMYPDGTLAQVTDVNGTTFSVLPVNEGEVIPLTDGTTEIIIVGNAHEEKSGQPLGRNGRVSKYTNNLMILKASHCVSGTEMAQQLWIPVKDKNGKTGYVWHFKAWADMYKRYENECEMTMLLGEQITNPALAAINPTTTVTEGFIPFIQNYGNDLNYTIGSGYTMANLDEMVRTLNAERGARENTVWAGINLSLLMDDLLRTEFDNGGITYGAFNNSKDAAVNMQFSSFQRGNYVFHKKTYDLFSYKKTLGAEGHKFKDFGMVIPADKVAEAKTGDMVPSCRINYLENEGYSRMNEEWLTGGANGIYNTDKDEVNVNYRSHKGFEGFAPNRYVALTGL